jgi:hypothetical protein
MHKKTKRRAWEEVVADFTETLTDFCETCLSHGRRNGSEWQVPDLENSAPKDGKAGSCYVNLDSGVFYDHNPAAEPQKGGPVDLWKTLFGVEDFPEVMRGMEAWIKDGTLPDGTKRRTPKAAKTTQDWSEIVIRRDDFEVHQFAMIGTANRWLSIYREREEKNVDYVFQGHPQYPFLEQGTLSNTEMIKKLEIEIRTMKSGIYERRWNTAVQETTTIREDAAAELARYRGLSTEVFLWLIDRGHIAFYLSKRLNKEGGTYDSVEIAFPLRLGTEFVGMHCKWFGKNESNWRYEPKGLTRAPYIIGTLDADCVIVGESTWDVITSIDLYELYKTQSYSWCAIKHGRRR